MRTGYEFGQENFDAVLALFSTDRDEAAEKYQNLRDGLVRFFDIKGCWDPITLADETIDRVTSKIHTFDRSKVERPVSFFYGFASNVLKEHRRVILKEAELSDVHAAPEEIPFDRQKEARSACLDKCLAQLPAADAELVRRYYASDGREKINIRQRICEDLDCRATALHTKIFRIRALLRQCIERCLETES